MFSFFIILCFAFCIHIEKYDFESRKIDQIIKDKKNIYDDVMYVEIFHKKYIIDKGKESEVLKSNKVLLVDNGCDIDDQYGNIVLAGHNNKYVFSILYRLNINDIVNVSHNDKKYTFKLYEKKYVNIKNIRILDNISDKKIITLITCTNNNQVRLVLKGKIKIT